MNLVKKLEMKGEDEDQMGGAPPEESGCNEKEVLVTYQKEVEDFQGLLKTGKCLSV